MIEPVIQNQVRVFTRTELLTDRVVHATYGFLVGVGTGVSLTLALFILTGLKVC